MYKELSELGEFFALILFLCIAAVIFASLVIFTAALPVFLFFAIVGLILSIAGLLLRLVFGAPLLAIVIIACIIYFLNK